MSNITVTLVSGQTAVVGVASSREAYEVEVSSGVAGATGVGVANAAIVGGMLNITLSNTAVINAGSVVAPAMTGTVTFTDNTIGQFSNGTVNIKAGANVYAFGNTGVTFPDGTIQTTAFTGNVVSSNALNANNASYLGGVAANQYAYANQINSADRLTNGSYTAVLETNGSITIPGALTTGLGNNVGISTSHIQREPATAAAGSGNNVIVIDTTNARNVFAILPGWTVGYGSNTYTVTSTTRIDGQHTYTIDVPGMPFIQTLTYTFTNPTPVTSNWSFSNTGSLVFPDGTGQTTAFTSTYDQLTLGFPRIPRSTATNAIHAVDISNTNNNRDGIVIYDTGDSRVKLFADGVGWYTFASTDDVAGVATDRLTSNGYTAVLESNGTFATSREVYSQYFSLRGGNANGTIGSLGYGGDVVDLYGANGVTISTVTEGGPQWKFGTDGVFTTSGNGVIATSNTGSNTSMKIAVHWNDPSASPAVNHVTSEWTFARDSITFPDTTSQTTAFRGYNADTMWNGTHLFASGVYLPSIQQPSSFTLVNEGGMPGVMGSQTLTGSNPAFAQAMAGQTISGNNLIGTTTITAVTGPDNYGGYEITTDTTETNPFWYGDTYTISGATINWSFEANGALTIPSELHASSNANLVIQTSVVPDASPAIHYTWSYGVDGGLMFPDATTQYTAFTGSYDQLTTGFVRVPQYATATNIFQYLHQDMSRTGIVYVNQSSDALTYWAPTANAFLAVQTTSGLSSNVATLTSNNTLYLGGTAANQYTTYTGSYTWSGNQTFTGNVAVVNINSEQHAQVGYNITGVPAYSGAGSNTYIWMNAALSNTNTQAVIAAGDITGWTVTAEDNPSVTATVISMNPVGYWGIGTNVALAYAAGRTFKFTSPNYAPAYTGPVNVVANGYSWAFNANGSLKFADNTLQTTAFTGNANNALYLGGVAAANYLTVSGGNITANTGGFEIGYKDVPQNYTNTSFTLALSDRGKHIYTSNGTAQTITIANNATVAFPVGTAISIVSQGAGTITVARGTGVSLYLAANNTSADRTIATYGMATLLKVAADTWFISGAGVA